jgi:DNA replication and repair protein RecF
LETGTAKDFISRGQQKLLACALITASVEIVQMYNDKPLLLLVDDPKAELDRHSTRKLMKKIAQLDSQVIATSIDPEEHFFEGEFKMFHVEQKKIKTL